MRKSIIYDFLLIITILLTGCEQRLSEGIICNKEYEPPRTWLQPIVIIVGETTRVTNIIHYDDADFVIVICEPDSDRKSRIYATEELWQKAELGSWFCISDNCDDGCEFDDSDEIIGEE